MQQRRNSGGSCTGTWSRGRDAAAARRGAGCRLACACPSNGSRSGGGGGGGGSGGSGCSGVACGLGGWLGRRPFGPLLARLQRKRVTGSRAR